MLNKYLSVFDHTVLTDDLSRAEDIGANILLDLNCCRVEVSRPLERLYAIVERGNS